MSSTGRKITLKSSDGETFEVDEAVALESQTIKLMIEDDCADNGIPLPNVPSKILSKVIEYCKKHVEAPKSDDGPTSVDDELKVWDADFVKVDQATLKDDLVTLYHLMLAADYLIIESLIVLTCQAVPGMPKGLTPGDIQKIFDNDDHFVLTMSSTGRKFCLMSCDGYMFMVTEAVALEFQTIKNMLEDHWAIPVYDVTGKILSKVIEYCKKHVDDPTTSVDNGLNAWDANFVKVNQAILIDLMRAADNLNIESLIVLTCQAVPDMPKGLTPEDILKIFNDNEHFVLTMSSTGRKFCLKSGDGYMFMVTEVVALQSQRIKHMIEDDCADGAIPLPNVTGKILYKVIEYCKKHVDDPTTSVDDGLNAWDANFVKVDQATLFDLIRAANHLDIQRLRDLTCQTVADMIKKRQNAKGIHRIFNIKNDFTREEERSMGL